MLYPVRRLLMIVLFMFCITACSDKNDPGPVLPQTFEWTIDNGATQSAESISFIRVANDNYIHATKGTTEIFLVTSSTLVGTYSLTATTAAMGLKIGTSQYENLAGEVIITSNSNSKLKGTFTGTFGLVNVDTVSITGSFEDVVYN